jgi:hypothetical protein
MIRAVEALLEDAARGDDTAALKLELLVERERVHKPNDHDIADTLGPQLLAVRLSTDDIGEIVQRIGGELSTAARPLASLACGIGPGLIKGFETEEWRYSGTVTYRIDLDKLVGRNLRAAQ